LTFNLIGAYLCGLIVLGLLVWCVLAILGRAPWPAT
jgi:hypothetical protein